MKIKIVATALWSIVATAMNAQTAADSLDFNPENYRKQTLTYQGKTFEVRAFENIIYVTRPVDTVYQSMNIYVPEAYFQGKTVNGYKAETAPIFFPNQIGGYMPTRPASATDSWTSEFPPLNGEAGDTLQRPLSVGRPVKENTVVAALAQGYVVASPGARGRTNAANDRYYGKAPAAIVDLKAAVRYLKHNDGKMPGDANKIISNGTSAGGALSALLGATGDHPDYFPYLEKLGAADASDEIFAVSAYCPITDLEHADMAYEWQFQGIHTYQKRGRPEEQHDSLSTLTEEQQKISTDLKKQFPAYVNNLYLKDDNDTRLTLDEDGNGTFKTWVKSYVIASANKALESGMDLSQHTWLTMDEGKVTDLEWDDYIHYMQRQKTPPAFDALDLSAPENNEFGTESINNQHFTLYGQQHSMVKGTRAKERIVKKMNPMHYIGTPHARTSTYWRIRHGSKDKDTSLAVPTILATLLQNNNYEVDFALPWDRPHSGDYDLEELFAWIDGISGK